MKIFKKKSLGQHFLKDKPIASKIVALSGISKDDNVVEIGPGDGALTNFIKEVSPKRTILIELDNCFYENIKKRFESFEVINQDACNIDFRKIFTNHDDQFMVVSNLPYNASTKILENLVGFNAMIPKMVLMFQKEVALRILAKTNETDYCRLSLLAQEFYEVKRGFSLRPGSFSPPPKVQSMVLVFNRRAKPLISVNDRTAYENLLRLMFSNRRKMLRKSLRDLITDDQIEKLSVELKIDVQKRPQELSIQDFANISNFISKIKPA